MVRGGVNSAIPAGRSSFEFFIETTKRLMHGRTDLKDNVRLDRDMLAPSNAPRVKRVVTPCKR